MFYGWYIVLSVFVAHLFLSGFLTYAFSLFVVPVQSEFLATRTEVMYSMTLATVLGLFISPVIGSWVDRYSPRWLMTGGALLMGGGLYVLAQSDNVYTFIIVFGLVFSAANLLLGPLTGSTVISRWFSANRGRALGIAATGTSVGGIVIPALVAWWLGQGDWRTTLENLSYCVLLCLTPLVLLLMRPAPAVEVESVSAHSDRQLGFKDILGQRAYWSIGVGIGLLFCVYSAVLANITPYATGLGLGEAQASSLIMVISICGFLGKLIFGFAADRINLRLALWLAQGLTAIGLAIFALQPSYGVMLISAAIMGLAAGGMLPVWGALLAAVFGVLSYGRVMGVMGPLVTLLIMPGFIFAGFMYDLNGNYQACFLVFIGVLAFAALSLRLLPSPDRAG